MRSSTVTERMVGGGSLDIRPLSWTDSDGALVRALRLIAHRTRHQPWTDEIPGILGDLAEATGAIRVFLFEGFDGSEGDPSKVLGSWASEHATPFGTADAERCAAAAGLTEGGTVEVGALLLAPTRIGRVSGVVGLEARVGRRWTEAEGDALATVADLIAGAEDRRIGLARQEQFAQVPVVVYEAATTPDGGPGLWTYASPRLHAMLGFTPEEWVGREDAWMDALDPEDVATATDEVRRAINHGTPLRTEYRLHRKDDRVVWVRDEAEIVAGEDGRQILRGVLEDVTDRRNLEDAAEHTMRHFRESDEQRRGLVRRLTAAQEEERARIAAEIHGDSIQAMTVVGLRLDALRPFAERDDAVRPVVEQLRRDVRDAIGRMRRLFFELQPRLLDDEGLVPALRSELAERSGLNGCRYRLEDDTDGLEPAPDARLVMFRIVQDALNNVRQHAHSTNASVSVSRRPGGFLTAVVDDGCGFDPVMLAHAAPEHHGLLAMRERAEDAGGWFRVDSSPGSGTRVQFFVPEAPA